MRPTSIINVKVCALSFGSSHSKPQELPSRSWQLYVTKLQSMLLGHGNVYLNMPLCELYIMHINPCQSRLLA